MERNKRIKRKDRFLRIKNKSEPVYRTPVFLKNAAGVSEVSESGIFKTGGRYTKSYFMETDILTGEQAGLFLKLEQMNAAYGFIKMVKNEKTSLLIAVEKKDMQEAIVWFAYMEQETGLEGINAEGRLEYYCRFLTLFLNAESRLDSYLQETRSWKPLADMIGLKAEDHLIRTEAGVFSVMAIRRFPDKISRMPAALTGQEAVIFAYTEICPVTDSSVMDMLQAQYLGIDGVLPRLKRGNPSLYNVIKAMESKRGDTGSFVAAFMFFLLHTKDRESMELAEGELCRLAEEKGMLLEHVPVMETRIIQEAKRELSLFGMSGKQIGKYRNLILASDKEKLFPQPESSPNEVTTYDIEELRTLFYKNDLSDVLESTNEVKL